MVGARLLLWLVLLEGEVAVLAATSSEGPTRRPKLIAFGYSLAFFALFFPGVRRGWTADVAEENGGGGAADHRRSDAHFSEEPHVQIVRCSPEVLDLRNLQVRRAPDGSLLERSSLLMPASRGDISLDPPNMLGIGDKKTREGEYGAKHLKKTFEPLPGQILPPVRPLFSQGEMEVFIDSTSNPNEPLCLEGGRYVEGRLVRVTAEGRGTPSKPHRLFAALSEEDEISNASEWLRWTSPLQRLLRFLPMLTKRRAPSRTGGLSPVAMKERKLPLYPLRLDYNSELRGVSHGDLPSFLHGKRGFLVCLSKHDRPFLVYSPAPALPVFARGSWRARVIVSDVAVYRDMLDTKRLFVLRCNVRLAYGAKPEFISGDEEEGSEGARGRRRKRGRKASGEAKREAVWKVVKGNIGRVVVQDSVSEEGTEETEEMQEEAEIEEEEADSAEEEEVNFPFAFTGLEGKSRGTEEDLLSLELSVRADVLAQALHIAALLEGCQCVLQKTEPTNRLDLRCPCLLALEVEYGQCMEGMKRLENREALELFRKALRASAIGLLSHVEAVQSQSVLWGTPQGAEFQESLYWSNPRLSWSHLLFPGNLSLALFNEDPSIRVHGTMQSAGMMLAALSFAYALFSMVKGFAVRGEEDQIEAKLWKSYLQAVMLAEEEGSLLKPELTIPKQLTLYCIDGRKP